MKKLSLLLALLLCLGACGQATAPEETTSAAETTTESITVDLLAEIEYPASYKDAPAAYKLLLDEYYLSLYRHRQGEELHDYEYEILSIMDWYPPDAEFGYAVVDINRDGILELLLLFNTQAGESIMTIYTLKGNKPALIANFGDRTPGNLAADGTVYTYYHGGAAAGTYGSFKLEPGAAEPTYFPWYHFNMGWGDETPEYDKWQNDEEQLAGGQPITKEEFDAMVKERESKPPMAFEFIPLAAPATETEEITTITTTTTQEKTALEAYKPILDDYRGMFAQKRSGEELTETAWSAAGFLEDQYSMVKSNAVKSGGGYALADLNNDGTPELVLGSGETIFVLFTLRNNKPVWMLSKWYNGEITIYRDGVYMIRGSSVMQRNSFIYIYKMGTQLAELRYGGEAGVWKIDGKEVTENTLRQLEAKYAKDPVTLKFLPLEQ